MELAAIFLESAGWICAALMSATLLLVIWRITRRCGVCHHRLLLFYEEPDDHRNYGDAHSD